MKEVIRINLDNEMDLILAHRRAIKLAELCGLAPAAQTRFATAVSEIARCSIVNGIDSYLILGIGSLSGGKKVIRAIIYDNVDLIKCNPEAYAYASRLSQDIVTNLIDGIYEIILNLKIPYSGIISESRIASFKEYFKKEISLSPYEELRKKNIQLIELSEKLSESETKYRQLTDTLPLIVFSVAQTGSITLTNRRFEDLIGNLNSFSLASMGNIFHIDDISVVSKGWDIAKRRGNIFSGQARVKIKDLYIWHLISIVPDNNEKGELSGWIISMVDIQAQKDIEEALKDNKVLRQMQESLTSFNEELTQKNMELEQFAYIASHDLQEPLRKIRNFTSLAERNLTEEQKDKLYFNKINLSAERMSRLITDVLNYSKLSGKEGKFVDVDLNDALQEVLSDFEFQIQEKSAVIKLAKLPIVKGITVQLGQLFYNLLGNSLKFTQGAPVIEITYEFVAAVDNQAKNKSFHKISVSDNGIGIDSRYVSKIFTIFKRLHTQNEYEGTGIGLALCDKIIKNHGGFIELNSQLGLGTTINIYLP